MILCQLHKNLAGSLGTKITDEELAALNITRDAFHGDWNYTISPKI
jgi:hypothetical protein